jgi:hypothetical protein
VRTRAREGEADRLPPFSLVRAFDTIAEFPVRSG